MPSRPAAASGVRASRAGRATPAASFPGPTALGRGVVVAAGAATPVPFTGAPRVRIDDEVLARPAHTAQVLHHLWLRRVGVVIELAVDPTELTAPETTTAPPTALDEIHTFHRERLAFLTWANTYDLRSGQPVWWHGVLAQRRTGAAAGRHADVQLPDGREAWADGGPRGPLATPLTGPDAHPLVHRESIGLGRLTLTADEDSSGPGRSSTRPAGAGRGSGTPSAAHQLAPDQLAAVHHRAGPARIIAPAGSGKTRVLTARLQHLRHRRRIEPELITAVAYNTRAAAELRGRVDDPDVSIRTLHSLAWWIVQRRERREVITERAQREILDGLLRVGRQPNQDPFAPYLEALAEVRLGLRDPATVEAARGDVDGFTELFDRYRAALAERRVLDFDEQIYRALELLLGDAELRREVQRVGTHLLVDEFQDLTPAFLLLVRLVAGPPMQVFAVGDDDQTIYRYAGASPDFLVRFDRWFPGAEHHALEVNYRCPTDVVTAASHLLSHNTARVPKTIRAHRPPSDAEVRP